MDRPLKKPSEYASKNSTEQFIEGGKKEGWTEALPDSSIDMPYQSGERELKAATPASELVAVPVPSVPSIDDIPLSACSGAS